MSVYLQVLGTSPSSPPTIYLTTEFKRYLFNAGEGIQRYCSTHKIRMVKTGDLFLTRVSIGHFGGVPGLVMTLADYSTGADDRLTIHGPMHTAEILKASRSFASNGAMPLEVNEIGAGHDPLSVVMSDENITVRAIVLSRSSCRKRTRSPSPTIGVQPIEIDASTAITSPVDSELLSSPAADTESVLCYVVQLSSLPGKFNADRARDLGLVPGPDFRLLVNGLSVDLPDGQTIRPEDVVGPPRPRSAFLIIDCPSRDYIHSLTASVTRGAISNLDLVVHLTPDNIAQSPEYIAWMASAFAPTVHHMFCSDNVNSDPFLLRASALQQLMMHFICPEAFIAPLPTPQHPNLSLPMTKYMFAPCKAGIGVSLEDVPLRPDPSQVRHEMMKDTDLASAMEIAHNVQATLMVDTKVGVNAPVVTFLGTGCAAPSKYRGSSAIDLFIPEREVRMLIDCGEGALAQLHRLHGPSLLSYMRSLRLIWISHKHADHHVGLLSIIRAHRELVGDEHDLVVIAPIGVIEWCKEFARLSPDQLRCHLIDCRALEEEGKEHSWALSELGFNSIRNVRVIHCSNSFGLIVVHEQGWKLVYSGDTRPCQSLIDAGLNATLLIHEATFEDELAEEALFKKHCTTREALDVARKMNATEAILTHFSQRYPKIPKVDDKSFDERTCVAFDLMAIRFDRLHVIPSALICLDLLLTERVAPVIDIPPATNATMSDQQMTDEMAGGTEVDPDGHYPLIAIEPTETVAGVDVDASTVDMVANPIDAI